MCIRDRPSCIGSVPSAKNLSGIFSAVLDSVLLIIWYWYIIIIFSLNYIVLGGEITKFQDDKE